MAYCIQNIINAILYLKYREKYVILIIEIKKGAREMIVFNLLISCANVSVTSDVEITNKYSADLYRGTYEELILDDHPLLNATVDTFLISKTSDKITVYVER